MDKTSTALSITHLSISEFTNSTKTNSRNIGVVELMILQVIDKVIYNKTKWLLAIDLSKSNEKTGIPEQICLETVSGLEFSNVDVPIDTDITNIEKSVYRESSVLNHLIIKYGLKEVLKIDGIYWKSTSMTTLRRDIVDVFSRRDYFIDVNFVKMSNVDRKVGGIQKMDLNVDVRQTIYSASLAASSPTLTPLTHIAIGGKMII